MCVSVGVGVGGAWPCFVGVGSQLDVGGRRVLGEEMVVAVCVRLGVCERLMPASS